MRRVTPSVLTSMERLYRRDTQHRHASSTATSGPSSSAMPTPVEDVPSHRSNVSFSLTNIDSSLTSTALSPDRSPPSPCPSPANHRASFTSPQGTPVAGRTTADAYRLCHEAFEQMCAANTFKFAPLTSAAAAPSLSINWLSRVGEQTAAAAAPHETVPCSTHNVPLHWNGTETATVFHSSLLPSISLADLGIMIAAHVPDCPAEMTIAALVLARRYCSMTSTQPTAHMMHRLYLACLQLVIKAHCDFFVSSRDFARISGLSPKEMFRLERHVIQGVGWRAQVARAETQHEVESCARRTAQSLEIDVSWEVLLSSDGSGKSSRIMAQQL